VPTPAPPETGPAPADTHLQPSSPSSTSSSATTWALVVGGVGVASLATGAVFGLVARAKWNDAHAVCPKDVCTDPAAVDEGNAAAQAADFSTTFFALGGAAAVATVVLFAIAAGQNHGPGTGLYVTPLLGSANGLALGGKL
jgi:hypothetical protein